MKISIFLPFVFTLLCKLSLFFDSLLLTPYLLVAASTTLCFPSKSVFDMAINYASPGQLKSLMEHLSISDILSIPSRIEKRAFIDVHSYLRQADYIHSILGKTFSKYQTFNMSMLESIFLEPATADLSSTPEEQLAVDLKFLLECSLGRYNGVSRYINYVSSPVMMTCLFKSAEYGYPHILDFYYLGHATRAAMEEAIYVAMMSGNRETVTYLMDLLEITPDGRRIRKLFPDPVELDIENLSIKEEVEAVDGDE